MDDSGFNEEATHIIRAELARRGITYRDLARRLNIAGETISERAIATKISRGTYSFSWLIKVSRIIGIDRIDISPK